MGSNDALFKPIKMGTKTAVNRIALNAMECNDADKNGDPSEPTYTRYRKNFEGNAGVAGSEDRTVRHDGLSVPVQSEAGQIAAAGAAFLISFISASFCAASAV